MNKKVVVLILSYNGKELLADSASSYLACDYSNFEVVVIDNGSIDGSKEYVEENWPDAKVYRTEQNRGYSGGLNFGLAYAFGELEADYALITNNDVKVDSKVISSLVEVANTDPSIGFVSGKVYYFDHPDTLQTTGKGEDAIKWNGEHIGGGEKDRGLYDEVVERIFLDDIFMLVSKPVYQQVGDYDTEFFLQCEEWDWQARAKEKGFKCMYAPEAKIWHKESMTIGKWSPTKAYYNARNPGIVIMRYKNKAYVRRYLKHHTFSFLLKTGTKNLLKGKVAIYLAMVRGYFSMLSWGFKNGFYNKQA